MKNKYYLHTFTFFKGAEKSNLGQKTRSARDYSNVIILNQGFADLTIIRRENILS